VRRIVGLKYLEGLPNFNEISNGIWRLRKLMDSHTRIAECAYNIWKRKGCPEDRASECWLEAETELKTAGTLRFHMRKIATARAPH
jgi:hypothetical protein